MNFEITGKLIEVYPVTSISDKFKKREFVIAKTETRNGFDFTDYVKFQLVQDKCSLIDLFKTGDQIKVSFNLRGRKWEKDGAVNYFTNLEAWKVEKSLPGTSQPDQEAPPLPDQSVSGKTDFFSQENEVSADDLPF